MQLKHLTCSQINKIRFSPFSTSMFFMQSIQNTTMTISSSIITYFWRQQYELLVLLMNPYDIIGLYQTKSRQHFELITEDCQTKLYQILHQRNIHNQIFINQYLKNIAKKEKKIKKMPSDGQLLEPSTRKKSNNQQLINEGICYSSQEKILTSKYKELKQKQNPEAKCTSILRHTRQYKKVKLATNNRSFLQPIQPTPLPTFFQIITPTQSLPSEKPRERKQNMANQLRKLLLKQVYSLHQNLNKPIQFQLINDEDDEKNQRSQHYWIQKHLNIKRIGIDCTKNVRKIKTQPVELQKPSEIKYSLRGSELRERSMQVGKSFPKVSGSHLQRNKRCLQMFLKFTTQKKRQNLRIIRSWKTQAEELNSLKKFNVNTLPLKKQI